jgi:hypothetical protein
MPIILKQRTLRLGALFLLSIFSQGSLSFASNSGSMDYVRISAINGVFSQVHAKSILVHPGDLVRLSADTFEHDHYAVQNEFADDFVWMEVNSKDYCNLVQGTRGNARCPASSNFQATEDGVLYRVPVDMSASLKIVVANENRVASDSLILRNAASLNESRSSEFLSDTNIEQVPPTASMPTAALRADLIACPPAVPPAPCPVSASSPCPIAPIVPPKPTPVPPGTSPATPAPVPSPTPVPNPRCPIPGPV